MEQIVIILALTNQLPLIMLSKGPRTVFNCLRFRISRFLPVTFLFFHVLGKADIDGKYNYVLHK